jgi:lysophospholipase L1-like esterase
MLKKLNPSLSFLLFAFLLWLLQYGFDVLIGDGDGKITFLNAYIFIGFIQVFLIISALLWLPEVIRRLKGNFAATSQDFLKQNAMSLFTCFILFFIIIIDFFGFIIYNKKIQAKDYKASHYRTSHPCFHHGLVQNMAAQTNWGNNEYMHYTNSFAFKDSAVFEAKQNLDKKQIVFIGDSFTEGIGEPYETTFFGYTRKSFENNKNSELWNAGCISYSPLIYYNKIKYYTEIENLKIDYLWVFLDPSDIQDEVDYKEFEPKCGEKFVPKAKTEVDYVYDIKNDKNLFDIYSNHSLLFALTPSFYKALFPTAEQEKGITYQKNRIAWVYDDTVYQEWGKEGVESAENHLQKLADLCKEKNIKLTLVIYPWFDIIEKNERHVNTWTDFTTKNNIPLVNLFPVFSQKAKETSLEEVKQSYFLEGDVHWNAEGNRLIAESIKKPFEELLLNIEKMDSLNNTSENE